MKQWIANMKIRTKIILLCVAILTINSSVAGYLYYKYAFTDTLENTYSSSEDIIYQANNYLSDKFASVIRRVNAMATNVSFTTPMSNYLNDPKSERYAEILGKVANSLTELAQGDRYIHSIYMYTKYSDFDNFTRIRNHGFRFIESDFYKSFDNNPHNTVAWFPAMKDQIFTGEDMVIPVVFRFLVVGSLEHVYIVVNLQQSTIIKYLKDNYASVDKMFIVDQEGNAIVNYSTDESTIVESFPKSLPGYQKAMCQEVNYKGERYLCTFTTIKTNDWKLFSVKSRTDLLSNLDSLRTYIILILFLGIIISVIITVLLAISITTPINHLVKIMRRADQQDFHVKFHYPYKNEVGNLADGFNYMIGEIDHLISELNVSIEALKEEKENVKRVQKQKRLAELKALQAQINPHFLYNTLNAITWQAADQGASEISILSNSLGKFFRLSLSKGNEIITLRDEVEHVRSYLNIQRIRYKTKLNYEINIEENLLGIPTIKLILQPLVENSIYHGIKLKDSEGLIRIYSSKHIGENGILVVKLCVEDNGLGIEEERLISINAGLLEGKSEQKEGYGIYNVNERLKLYYGEDYGLMFESRFGEWTRATIIIPAQIIV